MTGEFNGYCSQYYTLTQLLARQNDYLNNLLNSTQTYTTQTNVSEIDGILKHHRKIHNAKTRIDETLTQLQEVEQTILMIMQYFDIPAGTILTAEIIDEAEFEIWADDNDAVQVRKIRDLAPQRNEANIITIKLVNSKHTPTDDDDPFGTTVTLPKNGRNKRR